MSITHVVALGGSLLRPEEAAARSMWMGQLRQLMVHLEGNGRRRRAREGALEGALKGR